MIYKLLAGIYIMLKLVVDLSNCGVLIELCCEKGHPSCLFWGKHAEICRWTPCRAYVLFLITLSARPLSRCGWLFRLLVDSLPMVSHWWSFCQERLIWDWWFCSSRQHGVFLSCFLRTKEEHDSRTEMASLTLYETMLFTVAPIGPNFDPCIWNGRRESASTQSSELRTWTPMCINTHNK